MALGQWVALGGIAAGTAAWAAERASHDYQLVRFQVPARVCGSRLMNSAQTSAFPSPNPTRDAVDGGTTATGTAATESTPGAVPPLRILHLSDTHLYRGREDLTAWLRRLATRAGQDFDFVVLTGDMLATSFGDAHLATRAFAPLVASGVPGAYVFGAHDYYANRAGNPLGYLVKGVAGRLAGLRGSGQCFAAAGSAGSAGSARAGMWSDARRVSRRVSRSERTGSQGGSGDFGRVFRDFLADSPWVDVNNRQTEVSAAGWRVALAGVDDPHIGRDVFPGFPGAGAAGGVSLRADSLGAIGISSAGREGESPGNRARLRIGLAHAPYARVLDAFEAAGADVVFCGHTHGGQVCWPGGRALVTNCDLGSRFASGVFSWVDGQPSRVMEPGAMRVSVSPGLGTSPFTPWRVFCPPAAFLVECGRNQ